jgi:hypothetical protein
VHSARKFSAVSGTMSVRSCRRTTIVNAFARVSSLCQTHLDDDAAEALSVDIDVQVHKWEALAPALGPGQRGAACAWSLRAAQKAGVTSLLVRLLAASSGLDQTKPNQPNPTQTNPTQTNPTQTGLHYIPGLRACLAAGTGWAWGRARMWRTLAGH